MANYSLEQVISLLQEKTQSLLYYVSFLVMALMDIFKAKSFVPFIVQLVISEETASLPEFSFEECFNFHFLALGSSNFVCSGAH